MEKAVEQSNMDGTDFDRPKPTEHLEALQLNAEQESAETTVVILPRETEHNEVFLAEQESATQPQHASDAGSDESIGVYRSHLSCRIGDCADYDQTLHGVWVNTPLGGPLHLCAATTKVCCDGMAPQATCLVTISKAEHVHGTNVPNADLGHIPATTDPPEHVPTFAFPMGSNGTPQHHNTNGGTNLSMGHPITTAPVGGCNCVPRTGSRNIILEDGTLPSCLTSNKDCLSIADVFPHLDDAQRKLTVEAAIKTLYAVHEECIAFEALEVGQIIYSGDPNSLVVFHIAYAMKFNIGMEADKNKFVELVFRNVEELKAIVQSLLVSGCRLKHDELMNT